MTAPLAAGYRARPLWHEGVIPEAAPAGPSDLPPRHADVAVIGAGYCGVTAAAALARRGRSVVVVDADDAGGIASTRNGGMVIPELKHGPEALERRHGAVGRELVAHTLDAYAFLRDLVVEEGIDCDWRESGGLLLAHHPRQVAGLRDAAEEWSALGEPVELFERDGLGAEIGSDAYLAGLLIERTAAVHPAKLHAALTDRAVTAGARIHCRTRATRIEPRDGRWRVQTTRGAIDSDDVLVAANAYVDGVAVDLQRRVLPIGSFVIASEPLPEALARSVMPGDRMCFDTKHLVNYWRLSPDRRMVFGGRASLSATSVDTARDVLYEQMVQIHPQLAGVGITHAWGGNVAVTLDRLPHCGRIDGVAYATGCNGTGVALATWFGERAAAWMSGDEDPPAFADLRFRPIPFRTARRWWLPLAGRALRLADRHGR